ncbi:MAG: hypothetical protein OXE46_09645 [Chloroflexi bacterium]|nr:hypothetical protein [Chloroflexota bacterium]
MCGLRMLALAGLLLCSAALNAQDLGQICLLAYADWDENGARDLDEPALNRGIGADLLNARGITIASELLVDSPFATDGLLCFNQLDAGDYRLRLTSAEYAATTNASRSATVLVGEPPPRIELGVLPLFEDPRTQDRGTAFTDAETFALLLAAGAFATALLLAVLTVVLLVTKPARVLRLSPTFRGGRGR